MTDVRRGLGEPEPRAGVWGRQGVARARIEHEAPSTLSPPGEVTRSVPPIFRFPPNPVATRRRASRVELGHVRWQMYGNQDLPGDGLALDQGDEAHNTIDDNGPNITNASQTIASAGIEAAYADIKTIKAPLPSF